MLQSHRGPKLREVSASGDSVKRAGTGVGGILRRAGGIGRQSLRDLPAYGEGDRRGGNSTAAQLLPGSGSGTDSPAESFADASLKVMAPGSNLPPILHQPQQPQPGSRYRVDRAGCV